MTARYFRLTEIHQRIDERLRRARRDGMMLDVQRLTRLKARVKQLIARIAGQPVYG